MTAVTLGKSDDKDYDGDDTNYEIQDHVYQHFLVLRAWILMGNVKCWLLLLKEDTKSGEKRKRDEDTVDN